MTSDQVTDQQIMADIAPGKKQHMVHLINRYQNKAMATAYRMLNRWDMAEDITQEAFLRIYKSASKYSPDAQFSTWFYRIVVNLCTDKLRSLQRQNKAKKEFLTQAQDHLYLDSPAKAQVCKETQHAVHQALDMLNERERIAVILHRFEGLSHKQIAQINKCSRSAVESLLVRAYKKLRISLKNYENH